MPASDREQPDQAPAGIEPAVQPATEPASLIRSLRVTLLGKSLYGNSAMLFANTLVLAGFGFVFWTICAHVYTTAQVGIATSLLAALNLITSFALVGLEISLIRFLPATEHPTELINASFTWTAALSVLAGAAFLIAQPILAPKLGIVHRTPLISLLFVAFCVPSAASFIVESIFVAYRAPRYVLVKNTIFSVLKLPLPFALVAAGAFGIYSASMFALTLAVLLGVWILRRQFGHQLRPRFRLTPTRGMKAFSFANYLATFAEGIPDMVLPLIVLALLGARAAAHYYIAMMLATVLFAVSAATGQALFAQGSHSSQDLPHHTRQAVSFTLALLVPGIIVTVLLGPVVLSLFGPSYASSATGLLRILALSSVLVAANDALRAIHKVKLHNGVVTTASALGSVAAVGLCFPFSGAGLTGIGLAWSAGQVVTLLILAIPLQVTLGGGLRRVRSPASGVDL
jgi:O-antigen/teichoic acid export membrane protein